MLCVLTVLAVTKPSTSNTSSDFSNIIINSSYQDGFSSSQIASEYWFSSDVPFEENSNFSSNILSYDNLLNSNDNLLSSSSNLVVSNGNLINSNNSITSSNISEPTKPNTTVKFKNMKAIWISYYELYFVGLSKNAAYQKVDKMLDKIKDFGLNTVICHVRGNSDSLYPSDYFPFTDYLTGTQGVDPGYDLFEYMVNAAHKRNLAIHAWINPYRVSNTSDDYNTLSDNNPAKIWKTDADSSNDRYVIPYNNKLYYNPAYPEVRKLVINGVREILEKYDVDGIQFDDYFYPTSDTTFDKYEYDNYCSTTPNPISLGDWRRANVNALVQNVYSAVHQYKDIVFGISPAADVNKNYSQYYADIEKWISTSGYIDYIAPQIYWGYDYPKDQYKFNNMLDKWMNLSRKNNIAIYIGLAGYKINEIDSTSDEWKTKNDILARQAKESFDKKTNGIMLFSYTSIFNDTTEQIFLEQRQYLKEYLKTVE